MTNHTHNTDETPDYFGEFDGETCSCRLEFFTIRYRLEQENAPLWRRILRLPRNKQTSRWTLCPKCRWLLETSESTIDDDTAREIDERFARLAELESDYRNLKLPDWAVGSGFDA